MRIRWKDIQVGDRLVEKQGHKRTFRVEKKKKSGASRLVKAWIKDVTGVVSLWFDMAAINHYFRYEPRD